MATLMFLTRLAVALATSLAAWTNCFLATGLVVRLDANLHALQSVPVCLAITVAAAKTYIIQRVQVILILTISYTCS